MSGLYYEQFEVDQLFAHPIRRTVTETDNVLFSTLTHNPAALHLDRHYCETETEFGQPLVNSLLTLSMMIGISVYETTLGTAIANLGMTECRFPKPVFLGDTLHVTSRVGAKRESRSRPGAGIVDFAHQCYNQNDVLVASCRRQTLMRKTPDSRISGSNVSGGEAG